MSFFKGLFKRSSPKSLPKTSPPKCPYCSSELDKKPARKKKCPHCSQYIFVHKGNLLTQEQKATIEGFYRLEPHGVTKKDFEKHINKLEAKYGSKPPINDVVWSILNELVSKRKNPSELSMIYDEMASFAQSEGKDPKPYQTQANKLQLIEYSHDDFVKQVEISIIEDAACCDYCLSMANKKFPIKKAIKEMPIPGDCTSEHGCRCNYVAVMNI